MDHANAAVFLIGKGHPAATAIQALAKARFTGRAMVGTWEVASADGQFTITPVDDRPVPSADRDGTGTGQLVTDLTTTRTAIATFAFQVGNGETLISPGEARDLTAAAVRLETGLAGLRAMLRGLS
jgi:hypothetical protein